MNVQQAAEAANVNSYQLQESFGAHTSEPGRLIVRNDTPSWVRAELERSRDRIRAKRPSDGGVEDLRFVGLHPRAFSSTEDDGGETLSHGGEI